MAAVYLIHDDASTELTDAPFASEGEFQHLLARHPNLLAGEGSVEGHPGWLLVRAR